MELRSRNNLHFVNSIKDGSAKRVLNVDTHRRPKLKFRLLEDVYKEGCPKDEWLPKIQPRAVRELDSFPDMTDVSCLMAAEMNVKHEPEDFDAESEATVCKIDGTCDDLGFGDMTLQQIRKQWKANKRKCQNRINIETANNGSPVKQECFNLQPENGGCDLEEPLSCWVTKLPRRRKEKKIKRSSAPSPAKRKGDFSVSYEIKTEALEDCCLVSETMSFFPSDPSPNSNKSPSVSGMVSFEVPITPSTVEEIISDEFIELPDTRRQALCSVIDKFALEDQENAGPVNALSASVSGEEIRLADNSEETYPQNSDFSWAESGNKGCAENPISSKTSLESECARENQEIIDQNPDMDVEVTNGETVKVESQETLSVEYSGLPLVGFAEENHITRAPSSNFSETDGLERDYHPEKNQIICSPNYSSPTASPRIQVQELDIDYIVLGLESCDLNTVESSCGTKDINKDDLPDASKTTAIDHQDSSDSASDDCMISGDEDYTSERRQSISYGYTDTTEHCEPILSSNVSETEGIQQQKLRHPPEKLFSGRKVISPSSQAKLCKAMEQPDSPEKRITKWKGKLYFSSQNAHRILKAKGLGDIERIVEASPTAKQVIQKPNNSGQTQHRKPAIKISRQNSPAEAPRRFSTACTTVRDCSQNAIAFSQRQMHDIQNLATKLTSQLQSMKEITERYLQDEEFSPSKLPKYNADEARIAVRNADRAEETARKWLSIMERDCNRFCKLMGMIHEDSAAFENIAKKKKKKITFADDAGGDLCHVKVFDIDMESPSMPEP